MATAIFYASSTGVTADVAKEISKQLVDIECIDIADDGINRICEFDKVILGNSTWGEGELQDDWEELWEEFSDIDFTGKTVALFGLGDQEGYADNYLDAMGIIYDKIIENGANVIGFTDVTDDYEFDASTAVEDGRFVGLALDDDNQEELTSVRVMRWCEEIKNDIL